MSCSVCLDPRETNAKIMQVEVDNSFHSKEEPFDRGCQGKFTKSSPNIHSETKNLKSSWYDINNVGIRA